MATRIFGPSKGNRRPTQVAPSKTPVVRPTAQKGGGGNKAAGSVASTAATTPTVSVSPTGQVTTEHFASPGASPAAAERAHRQAAAARQEAVKSRQRVQRVRSYVRSRDQETTPKREVHVSKAFLDKAAPPKPVTVAEHTRKLPGSEAPRAKPVKVAEHQRKAPEVKGTKAERIEARQKLQQAKKVVRKTNQPAQITGLHDKAQEEFAAELSKASGIPPKLAGEWVRQESGASAAGQGGEAGEQNELGVGYPAHPTSFSQSPYFNNTTPKKAADATAKWMEGKIGGEYGYQAAPSIQNIPKLAKSGASEEEVRSYIEGPSAWGTGQIAQSGVTATPGKSNPAAVQHLKAAVKEAKELGLKVTGSGPAVGKPTKQTVTKFQQIKHAAAELESKNLPYSWGGGHDANFSPGGEGENGGPGYDCSGAVSFVLHQAGVLSEPLTSGSMGSVLKPGPGAVTVFYNAEHTFMKIGNEYWGTSVGDSGAGGIGRHPTPSSEYLSQYNVGHVPGLGRKQALQLGFKPGSLTTSGGSTIPAFPGMEFTEGGTTATIEKGQGSKVKGKAQFSKKPIELTPLQQIRKNVNKLKSLGTEIAGPGEETKAEAANKPGSSSLHSQLAALEAKYKIGAV